MNAAGTPTSKGTVTVGRIAAVDLVSEFIFFFGCYDNNIIAL